MIYLDAASTSKPNPKVIEAMMPYFTDKWFNPSSLYSKANAVKQDIDNAKKIIADYINAEPDEIFFTSSGSESNCWAIQGFVKNHNQSKILPTIITSNIEHKSIISCVEDMPVCLEYVSVDNDGFINMDELEDALTCAKKRYSDVLVSIQFANNEIGVIQHIKEIAELSHKYGAIFHTDSVQAFGQVPIDVDEFGIDMLTASGHKIGCPKGIGFLYKKNGIDIKPLIYGSQMNSVRGGTENVPYIVGMAKAVELLQEDTEYQIRLSVLRNNFISKLNTLGCKVNGSLDERLPNNINITFSQNITGESLIYMLDTGNVYISSGSACNLKSIEPSYVLKAIGLSDEEAMRTIRITLPNDITMNEIDCAASEIEKSIKLLVMEVNI